MNAIAQFQNSIVWTTTGDGIFSNPNSLNPTYTPGPNDVGTTVILSLDLSGCQSLTGDDFMWLTVHPDPSSNVTGSTSICEATSTPVSIALTGTPPWSITYTDGTTPVTVNGILSSPFVFTVSPPVTTSYWVLSGNDAFCNIPPDSIHGLASVLVNPLPDPFRITVTNDGFFFCEGTPGVLIGLAGSEIGMTYELLRNGLPEGTNLPGTGAALNFGLKDIPGQYAVRGTNPVGNCQVMMQDTINVVMNPTPVTDFTTNEACTGDTTIFTVSGNFIARISQWHWDFGDGTFAIFNAPTDPWHVYPTYGTYTVTLSVEDTSNCTIPSVILWKCVLILQLSSPIQPTVWVMPDHFTELSTNPLNRGYIQQWVWNYGDGSPNDTRHLPQYCQPHAYLCNAGTYM
ncbi:MAG: PKD domain-containing protein [Bacteroidales bacterium]|nr:PKD domain-containing protein [Bacteroidales bacterium]